MTTTDAETTNDDTTEPTAATDHRVAAGSHEDADGLNDAEFESAEDEEREDGDDGEHAARTTASAGSAEDPSATEPAEVVPLPVMPDAVTGIVRGLATTIPQNGTLLLAIAKPSDDEVLVTILPAKGQNERESAIALVVRGTAEEIDRELVEALQHYVPARHLAVRTAAEIARETAAAAKRSQDSARARATTTTAQPKKKTPSLTVRITPKDATLRVVDAKDAVQTVTPSVAATVRKGRYIVTVTKPGFKTKIQNVVVGDGPELVDITLEQADQMSLLGEALA